MRFIDNYFRTMRYVTCDNGVSIAKLATVHTFWTGSDSETQRAYNAALATGLPIVVYKKLRGTFSHVPAVGEIGGRAKGSDWL
jgi:hypothetical protein